MIVFRTPKGWTGPGEGTPLDSLAPGAARARRAARSSRPGCAATARRSSSTSTARSCRSSQRSPPEGERRMSANPHANGGLLLRDLDLPDFRDYAVDVPEPARTSSEATRVLGEFLRDVVRRNPETFRLFGPDETASNRLSAVFEATDRAWVAEVEPADEHLAPDGRVMEVLSEHLCQGWLEGYLLTGRHGLFNCYEAFIHIIDSMFNQHAKWLKVTRDIPWRRPIGSLNYLLTSHVWRQDHNGFSHQDPGFIDHVVNKKAEIIRVYLPPDANCLLSVADHCLRSRDYVNVIVAGKQPALDYLTMDEAIVHCTRGIGIWDWAEQRRRSEPDVVLGCCRRGADGRDARRGGAAPRACSRPEVAGRERRRPDAPAAGERASARHARRRVRRAVHDEPAGGLRVPRLPLADPPSHLPPHEPLEPPRARLQGRGDDDDAVRHGDAERHGSLPPRDRRDRPRSRPRPRGPPSAAGHGRRAARASRVHARARAKTIRTSATGPGRTDVASSLSTRARRA